MAYSGAYAIAIWEGLKERLPPSPFCRETMRRHAWRHRMRVSVNERKHLGARPVVPIDVDEAFMQSSERVVVRRPCVRVRKPLSGHPLGGTCHEQGFAIREVPIDSGPCHSRASGYCRHAGASGSQSSVKAFCCFDNAFSGLLLILRAFPLAVGPAFGRARLIVFGH